MKTFKIELNNENETISFGKDLASVLTANDILVLSGDLGSGKTKLTQGILSYFGLEDEISSPTFTIVNEYTAAGRNETSLPVFHFDMYRVTDEDSLDSIGFYDYFARGGFIVTEWSENIPWALPEEYIEVKLERLSDDERRITAMAVGRERKDDETC